MAKYYHPDVLDNGLQYIITNCDEIVLLKGFNASTFTWTDVYTTDKLGTAAISGGDITLGNQGTNGRQAQVVQKTINGALASGAGPDLHVALVDVSATKVLAVTDETSDQQIYANNDVTIPPWNCKMNQPT